MVKNNEKGSTLVMVLLIVAVITILGASLFAMNMSASKQFTNKEHQVQARHLAEMGVIHYQAAVEEKVGSFKFHPPSQGKDEPYDAYMKRVKTAYNKELCNVIKNVEYPYLKRNSNSFYEVIKGQERDRDSIPNCHIVDYSTVEMSFMIDSKGTVKGTVKGTESLITAQVRVTPYDVNEEDKNNQDPDDAPPVHEKPDPPTEDVDERPFFVMEKREEEIVTRNLYITGDFNIEPGGGDKPNLLKVKRNLYVEGQMSFNNHACIVVDGDLTVLGDIEVKNKNKSFIVVYGNAYLEKKLDKKTPEVIYVKGKVNSKSGTDVKSHQELPNNWKTTCGITEEGPNEPEINELMWKVSPDVMPNYFPTRD